MASVSFETFGENLVNIVEEAITARENKILKALLQFQDNILQELFSLKQFIDLQCRLGFSKDANMHHVTNASDQLKDYVLNSLSGQTEMHEDSIKRKKAKQKCSSNSSKTEKSNCCTAQVFQKEIPSEIKAIKSPEISDLTFEKSLKESSTVKILDETTHQVSDPLAPAADLDGSLSPGVDLDCSLSPAADLSDHTENIGHYTIASSAFQTDDSEEFGTSSAAQILESSVSENVIVSSENINDFYVELIQKNLAESENFNIDFPAGETSSSDKSCKIFESNGYRCGYCDTIYDDPDTLDVHLSSHFNKKEKRYKCLLCGIFCTTKSTIHKHLLRHNGEKPFKCKICGRAFNIKYSLKRHLMTHTGERPFKCSVCNKAFARKDYRDVHVRSHWYQSDHGTGSNTFQ